MQSRAPTRKIPLVERNGDMIKLLSQQSRKGLDHAPVKGGLGLLKTSGEGRLEIRAIS
jgi:hypothetical protein